MQYIQLETSSQFAHEDLKNICSLCYKMVDLDCLVPNRSFCQLGISSQVQLSVRVLLCCEKLHKNFKFSVKDFSENCEFVHILKRNP